MSDIKKKDNRKRNWCCVVYEDSAPADWFEILQSFCVESIVSPYHDKDFNADGEPKKPHWHVMLMFDGKKTEEQVQDYFDLIGGVFMRDERTGKRIDVASIRGMARYFCHLDNPDKARYDTADVKCVGGANYFELIELVDDKYHTLLEIIDYCYENRICSFASLCKYARHNRFDWFRVICDKGTYFITKFLYSLQDEFIAEENRQNYEDFASSQKLKQEFVSSSFEDLK